MIEEIVSAQRRSTIAESILTRLPQWFAQPDSTREYILSCSSMPFWSFVKDGRDVGFIAMERTSPAACGIYVMGVLSEYHRMGIGACLVGVLKARAQSECCSYLSVKTVAPGHYPQYERTVAFYTAMGFSPVEVFPTLWDSHNPCLFMVQSLPQPYSRKPIAAIASERLTLRPFLCTDAQGLGAYLGDPEAVRFEPYAPMTPEQARLECVRRCTDPHFVAVCLAQGTLIGNLYMSDVQNGSVEVGYVFSHEYWGHGYAAESMRALMGYIFADPAVHRVFAMCDPLNTRSVRLLERLGLRREGLFLKDISFKTGPDGLPIWKDTLQYAVLREEYRH